MAGQNVILQKPLSELIADQIRRSIWNKELQFGDRLLETELADTFEVSRSTIREALKILEIEELVVSQARKGTYIAQFSDQDLKEITELRLMIESRAFIHALSILKASHFHILEEIIVKMKQEAEKGNWTGLFDLDMEFHSYVVNLSGNSRMVKIYDALKVQIRTVFIDLDQYYSNVETFYKEHQELLAGLKTKDPQIVKEKITDHIKFVGDTFLGVKLNEEVRS